MSTLREPQKDEGFYNLVKKIPDSGVVKMSGRNKKRKAKKGKKGGAAAASPAKAAPQSAAAKLKVLHTRTLSQRSVSRKIERRSIAQTALFLFPHTSLAPPPKPSSVSTI